LHSIRSIHKSDKTVQVETIASARRISAIRVGAVKTVCYTAAPFSRATSPSLILYATYSKLLELTRASNAGGVWKNRDSRRTSSSRSLLDRRVSSTFNGLV